MEAHLARPLRVELTGGIYPPRSQTPTAGSPDRDVLSAAHERVNSIAPSVLRFSELAVSGVDTSVKAGWKGEMKPALGPEALRGLSCAAILARIEDDVFRLEQAMQVAEVAADRAIALAARNNGRN